MKQVIGSFALFFAAASAMPFLAARQDTSSADLSAFHGSWYPGGMTDNIKGMLDDMTKKWGFTCDCYHIQVDGGDSGSSLKQHAACDINKDNKLLGQARIEGSLEFSSHENDVYTFKYTLDDTAFWPADGSDPVHDKNATDYFKEYDAHYQMLQSNGNTGMYEWAEYENEVWGVLYGKDRRPDDAAYDQYVKDLGNNEHTDGLARYNDQC